MIDDGAAAGGKRWRAGPRLAPIWIRCEATLTHYLGSNGCFFPERFPATFADKRQAKTAGRTFDIVGVVTSFRCGPIDDGLFTPPTDR